MKELLEDYIFDLGKYRRFTINSFTLNESTIDVNIEYYNTGDDSYSHTVLEISQWKLMSYIYDKLN